MSDFLERLSHRAMLSAGREADVTPLEPRVPGRYESPFPDPHEAGTVGFVEEDLAVPARPAAPAPRDAPREQDPPSPDGPVDPRPGATSHEQAPPTIASSSKEPATSADTGDPGTSSLELATSPASLPRSAPVVPAPDAGAAEEAAHDGGARAQPSPPATTEPLEPVIVVHRVPELVPTGPLSPPQSRRPSSVARSAPQPPTREPPAPVPRTDVAPRAHVAQATGVAPRSVVFEPREPLATVRLDPLADHEVLDEPALADVTTPDGVVHVHIGRLEVSRPTPTPPPPTSRRRAPTLTLDDYLAQRTTGGADGGQRP